MESSSKKPLVFVVDDEPGVARAVAQTIESIGCEVKQFSNASECIGALQNNICNLLISDVNMPKKDGLELLEEARKIQPLVGFYVTLPISRI